MNTRHALVIGAGLGGLATAVRLRLQGYRVTVLERRATPGGRCDRLVSAGFTFDTGPTLLVMRDVLERLFQAAGEPMEDYLRLTRLDPNYVVHFADGERLVFQGDREAMEAEVERLEPGAGLRLRALLAEVASAYGHGRRGVLERNFRGPLDYLRTGIPPQEALALLTRGRLDGYLGRFFRDRRLRDAFGFQTLYLGMSPFDSPALYAMLAYLELAEGIWYPEGGMASIPRALHRLAEKLGVEVRLQAEVVRLEAAGTRVQAVVLRDGERLAADLVVLNADLPHAYEHLLPGTPPARLSRLKVGASVYLWYLGIEGKVPGLQHHNLYLPADTARAYRQVCHEGRLPEDPFVYVCSPSVTQPELAPADGQGLYVLTMAPHLGHEVEWREEAAALRSRVIARLEREGIERLGERIRFEAHAGPPEFRDGLRIASGAPFGFTHHLDQVAYLRPHNRHARYGNVYFAGANTHPGGGVPMVLLSAQLVTERIAQEQPA